MILDWPILPSTTCDRSAEPAIPKYGIIRCSAICPIHHVSYQYTSHLLLIITMYFMTVPLNQGTKVFASNTKMITSFFASFKNCPQLFYFISDILFWNKIFCYL